MLGRSSQQHGKEDLNGLERLLAYTIDTISGISKELY